MRVTQDNAGRLSALVYTAGSLIAAAAFFAAASSSGDDWVARVGGSIWVFALMMIILMPTVTPFLRERAVDVSGGHHQGPAGPASSGRSAHGSGTPGDENQHGGEGR